MRLSIIGVGVLVAATTAGVGWAQPSASGTTTAAQDKRLDSQIERRIHADATLKKYDIDVKVEEGVATLTGTVATEGERTKAGNLAKVSGITRVDNKIVADLDAARHPKGTTGKIGDATKQAGEKTKEGAEKVAEKTKEGVSKTGEVITDAWITSRIKTKFMADKDIKASDINVDTDDHVVTLTGTVPSAAAHHKAINEAKEVEGVKRVVDRLKVVPK